MGDVRDIPALRRLIDNGCRRFVGSTANKCPINPHTGRSGNGSDPAAWGTLAEVQRLAPPLTGVTLAGDFTVVDLDDCRENGQISPGAQQIIDDLGGTVEISISGTGLHIYLDVARDARGLDRKETHGVEVYSRKRFIVVTGEVIRTATKSPAEQAAQLALLIERIGGETGARGGRRNPKRPGVAREHVVYVDSGLLEAAARTRTNARRSVLADLFVCVTLRAADTTGTGHVTEQQARAALLRACPAHIKHRHKWVTSRLQQVAASPFCEVVTPKNHSDIQGCDYRLPALSKIAEALDVPRGRRLWTTVAELFEAPPRQVAHLIQLANEPAPTHGPRPATRQTRRVKSGASRQTQRRAEQRVGATARTQFVRWTPDNLQPNHTIDRIVHAADGSVLEPFAVAITLPEHRRQFQTRVATCQEKQVQAGGSTDMAKRQRYYTGDDPPLGLPGWSDHDVAGGVRPLVYREQCTLARGGTGDVWEPC